MKQERVLNGEDMMLLKKCLPFRLLVALSTDRLLVNLMD